MVHVCTVKKEGSDTKKCGNRFLNYTLVSPSNPVRLGYFKSDYGVRKEQERHLQINPHVIHPFSKFRGRYELFLVVLYLLALLAKPLKVFMTIKHYERFGLRTKLTLTLDLLCWMDIIMTFFTGYTIQTQESNIIELRMSRIARHYVFSPYFICDVLSSIPKAFIYLPMFINYTKNCKTINVVLDIFMFLKFVRVVPLFVYIYRSAQYLEIKSKTGPFLFCILMTTGLIVHWAACLQFVVPKIFAQFKEDRKTKSWIYTSNVINKTIGKQYCHCLFKSSAYILGIRQTLYKLVIPEEYLLSLFTYFIGKLLVAFVWLVLAVAILNARSIDIKFMELMNQLNEYMRRKMLPLNLRQRLSQYYHYKYQKKYFKEDLIKSSLTGNVKKDVAMHICMTMIRNVSIFSDLSNEEVSTIVEFLVPEIFLPQDMIIQHGTYGDSMYFLSSGTVAVYTRSGKEICHLQDGAYFGEISLLLPDQTRNTSIVAIETTQLYRLGKKDFERYLLKNKKVLERIMRTAEERLREATLIEDEYKMYLFQQTLKSSRFTTTSNN